MIPPVKPVSFPLRVRKDNTHYKPHNAEPIPPFAALATAGYCNNEGTDRALALVTAAGIEPACLRAYKPAALPTELHDHEIRMPVSAGA